jgi:hypothetical protein
MTTNRDEKIPFYAQDELERVLMTAMRKSKDYLNSDVPGVKAATVQARREVTETVVVDAYRRVYNSGDERQHRDFDGWVLSQAKRELSRQYDADLKTNQATLNQFEQNVARAELRIEQQATRRMEGRSGRGAAPFIPTKADAEPPER